MALLKANNIYFDSLGRVRIVSEASLNSMDFTFGYGLTNAAGFSANTRNFTFLTTNNDVVIDGYAARRDFELNFLGLNSNSQKFKFGQIRMAANSKTSGSELGHMSFTIFSNTEPTKGQSIVFDTTGLSPGTNSNAKSLGITRGWANVALESNGRIVFNSGAQEISFTHNNTTSAVDVKGIINFDREATVNGNPMFAGYGLLNVRYFTGTSANTVYTPPANCRAILVELVGAGGGGGSANGIGAGSVAGARGGGGGGYTALLIANTNQTFKYTVGAGGAGGPGGATGEVSGSDGGATYFYGGSLGTTILLAIGGGSGGSYMTASTSNLYTDDGGKGGTSLGYDGSLIVRGDDGGGGMRGSLWGYGVGGRGGRSFFSTTTSGAQINSGSATGTNGIGFGEGGGGAACADTTGNPTGGDGQNGIIKITEYS